MPAAENDRGAGLANELAKIGLQPLEARIFVHLNEQGPRPAGAVAHDLRISRPRAYRALEALVREGLVTIRIGRPQVFVAVEPAALLTMLRQRAATQAALLSHAQDLLVPRLEAMRGRPAAHDLPPLLSVVRGLPAVTATVHALVQDARRSVDVLLANEGGLRLVEAVGQPERLERRAAAGVKVRVLLTAKSHAHWAVSPGAGMQHRRLDGHALASMVVADGRDCLLLVSAMGRGHRLQDMHAVRTNETAFVATQQVLFEHLWGLG